MRTTLSLFFLGSVSLFDGGAVSIDLSLSSKTSSALLRYHGCAAIFRFGPPRFSLPHTEPPLRSLQAPIRFASSSRRRHRRLRPRPLRNIFRWSLRRSSPQKLRCFSPGNFLNLTTSICVSLVLPTKATFGYNYKLEKVHMPILLNKDEIIALGVRVLLSSQLKSKHALTNLGNIKVFFSRINEERRGYLNFSLRCLNLWTCHNLFVS